MEFSPPYLGDIATRRALHSRFYPQLLAPRDSLARSLLLLHINAAHASLFFTLSFFIFSDSKSLHHIGCVSGRGDLGAVRGKAGHSVRSAVSCALDRLLTYSYIQYLTLPSTTSTLPSLSLLPDLSTILLLHNAISTLPTLPDHPSHQRPLIAGKPHTCPHTYTYSNPSKILIHPIAPPFFFVGNVD